MSSHSSNNAQLSTPPSSPRQHPLPPASDDSDGWQPGFTDPEPTGAVVVPRSQTETPESLDYLRSVQDNVSTSEQLYWDIYQALQNYQQSYAIPRTEGLALEEQNELERQRLIEEYEAQILPTEYPSPPATPINIAFVTYRPNTIQNPYGMTTQVSDNAYKIAPLKGHENYPVWKIQMQDMLEEIELWSKFISTTNLTCPVITAAVPEVTNNAGVVTTPGVPAITATDISTWDKKVRQGLGLIRRRVEAAPMTHVARCIHPAQAWNALCRVYETIGAAAMTLLRNKFTGMRMNEGDNLEDHIKNIRSVYDELNIALMGEGSTQISELEFIRQLLASLPESWQYLVSVLDQTPRSTDPDGTQLSADLQSRLLAEYHRRKAQNGESINYAWNNNSRGRQPRASD